MLCFEIEADHDGGTGADNLVAFGVDGSLLERETLVADVGDASFDFYGVAVEDGSDEVGADVCNDRNHFRGTIVHLENGGQIVLLPEVIVGKIGVVIDVTVTVHVVEANLYGQTVVKTLFLHEYL